MKRRPAREFEVAQDGKSWSLPSHKNYPADAKDQVAAAVAALVDVKYLGPAVSSNPNDHELYGVVEPKPAEDQLGRKGVGKLVVLENGVGKPLARIIIGKEDKSPKSNDDFSQAPQTQLRFVRIPGQDAVYRVAMRTDKFSTKFEDWIETDLLKMNPWDISQITLHDYSLGQGITRDGELRTVPMPRTDIDLAFDDKSQKWELKDLTEYKDNKPAKEKLGEGEELDTTHLTDLKNALGSLKIIDVARKPAALSAKLKAETGALTQESFNDLARRGFQLVPVGENEVELLSSDGEAVVRMKDGVEYVLRFGKVAGIESSSSDDEKKADDAKDGSKKNAKDTAATDKKSIDKKTADKNEADKKAGEKTEELAKADENKSVDEKSDDANSADKKEEDKSSTAKKGTGLSRYIMVMAQFNPEMIAKPELEPLPETKKAPEKATTEKASADKKGDTKKSDSKGEKSDAKAKSDAKDTKKDAAKSDSKAADAKAADAKKSTDAKSDAKADNKSAATKSDAKSTDAKSDAKSADAKSTDAKSEKSDAKSDAAADDDQEAIEAERDKIEKENKRKQADYDEKLKKGQDRAKELNARFADWYYVVNDETYRKIHLGKPEIVKKKAADAKNGKDAGAPDSPKNPFEGLKGLPGAGE